MQRMGKKGMRMVWEMFTGKFLLGQIRTLRAGGGMAAGGDSCCTATSTSGEHVHAQ